MLKVEAMSKGEMTALLLRVGSDIWAARAMVILTLYQ